MVQRVEFIQKIILLLNEIEKILYKWFKEDSEKLKWMKIVRGFISFFISIRNMFCYKFTFPVL